MAASYLQKLLSSNIPRIGQSGFEGSNVSGLDKKGQDIQVNTLMYCMGDEADDILGSFQLSSEDKEKYDVVKEKFEGDFVKRRNVIFERAKEDKNPASPSTILSRHYTVFPNTVAMANYVKK